MKKVLLIEDDRWLAASYKQVLNSDFNVDIAADGEQAVGMIDSSPPDVILADIMLEGHTAVALLNELQSYDDTRHIPVVLCSALDHESLQAINLKQYGVKKVLDKATLTPAGLIGVVKEVTS